MTLTVRSRAETNALSNARLVRSPVPTDTQNAGIGAVSGRSDRAIVSGLFASSRAGLPPSAAPAGPSFARK